MAIYKLIANGAFGQMEIEATSAAYENALVNIGIANRTGGKADIGSCTAQVRF